VHYLGAALLVSVAAQLTTLPILAATFNVVPLITPLSNLVCVPLAGLATAAGVVTLLVAPLGAQALLVTSACTWLTGRALALAVKLFAGWSFPQWHMATPDGLDVALYYGALAALYLFWRSAHLRRPLVCLALVVVLGLQVRALGQSAPELEGIVFHRRGSICSALRWADGDVWWITEYGQDARCRRIIAGHSQREGWGLPSRVFALSQDPVPPDVPEQVNLNTADPLKVSSSAEKLWIATPTVWSGTQVLHSLELSTPCFTAIWSLAPRALEKRDTLAEGLLLRVGAWPSSPLSLNSPGPDSVILITSEGPEVQPETDSPGSVRFLHTRRTGAVRIVWTDGVLQTETSIR